MGNTYLSHASTDPTIYVTFQEEDKIEHCIEATTTTTTTTTYWKQQHTERERARTRSPPVPDALECCTSRCPYGAAGCEFICTLCFVSTYVL